MIKYTIKKILSHLMAAFVVFVGMISMIHFITNNGLVNFIYGIGSLFIFYPAISYWYEISKRILNIKDDE